MASDLELTIHYEETEDGYVTAKLAEVPAAVSFGRTREEAREAVLDALRELVLSYLEPAEERVAGSDETVRISAALR